MREEEAAEQEASGQGMKVAGRGLIKRMGRQVALIARREVKGRESVKMGMLSPLPPLFTPTK